MMPILVATGAVVSESVPRAAAPWLADSTHGVPGTNESYNVWQAAHLKWNKDRQGHDRLNLRGERASLSANELEIGLAVRHRRDGLRARPALDPAAGGLATRERR